MAKTKKTPEVNRALKEICTEKRITPAELARRMDINPTKALRWITSGKDGGGHGPSLAEIPEIEDAIGVPRGEILRRTGKYIRDRQTLADHIRTEVLLDPEDRELAVEFILRLIESAKAKRFKAASEVPAKDGDSIPDAM